MSFRVASGTAPLLFLFPAALFAQSVELQLREEANGTPVAGAIVRLLGDSGVVAQGLTNEAGRIVLRAPRPGTYRVKADRIGWSGLLTDPLALASGGVLRQVLVMPSIRRALPTLVVRGRSRCDPGGQGGPVAAILWEEIRNALTANTLTQRERAVPLHVREFVRELNQNRRLQREWVYRSTVTRGNPFTSIAPAELASLGFVHTVGDSTAYSAPDAALLLSDEFVGTHCFRVVPGEDGLVGLAFEPVPGRTLPDVEGTLWVDRPTSELKFLEYSYTGLPDLLRRARLGGRVEFQRLPAGAWIVSYWHIRMPFTDSTTIRAPGGSRLGITRLVGFLDQGGRAELETGANATVDRALILGTVIDSTTGGGLSEVVVRVDGNADSVLTDALGRFELAVRASGRQVVVATHPKLGLVRDVPRRDVVLSLGDTTVVSIATPSLPTFVRSFCGSGRGRSGVVGFAVGHKVGMGSGLEVRVRVPTGGGWRQDRSAVGPGGVYALCDLPSGATLPLRLHQGNQPLAEERVRLEPTEFRWLDLRASPGSVLAAGSGSPGRMPVLAGVVREDSTRRPLAGVEVVLEGTDLRASTTESGRYTLDHAPLGIRILLFRSIGWKPVRLGVRIVEADTVWSDVGLIREGVVLDSILVTERAAPLRGLRDEFEERRALGFGRFIDSTELRRNEHRRLDDLLRGISGVRVTKMGGIPVIASLRKAGMDGSPCQMAVYLNGVPLSPPIDISRDFSVAEIEAVEVYRGGGEVPHDFGGAGASCGVVVLWTRRG